MTGSANYAILTWARWGTGWYDPAIMPPLGWQPPPPECVSAVGEVSPERLELLRTRGLFVLSVRAPAAPEQGTFTWIWQPPNEWPEGSRIFIDGSLFDEARRWARRTGFGVAIVSSEGSLLAFGSGIPPSWIVDAAGAELWAFYVVVSMTPFLPHIVTDCKGIVDGLASTPQQVTGRRSSLARTWRMVAAVLDWDFEVARGRVTWMPAHGSIAAIGHAKDSRGHPIDATMWRANRLVDLLAKAAASKHRLPAWVWKQVQNAGKFYLHHCARLGKATHDANNFKRTEFVDGGGEVTRVVRDSTAAKSWARRRKRSRPELEVSPRLRPDLGEGSPTEPEGDSAKQPAPLRPGRLQSKALRLPADVARGRKRAAGALAAQLRGDAQAEAGVARWVAGLELQPRTGPTSAERMSALRARISSRQQPAG